MNRLLFYGIIAYSLVLIACSQNEAPAANQNISTPPPTEEESQEESNTPPSKFLLKRIVVQFDSLQNKHLLYGQETQGAGNWRTTFDTVQCVVGKNGIAAPGQKREGDGMTPSGTFSLGPVFAYEDRLEWEDNFIDLEPHHYWVDDTSSPDYNTLIEYDPAPFSAEKMLRDDHLYKHGIVIQYNTNPIIKGMGSAIFLHIYRSPDRGTAGCVAMDESDLLRLIYWFKNANRMGIKIVHQ